MSAETSPHPFEPDVAGMTCRNIKYPEWARCGASPTDPIHTGTRPKPDDLEFPYPPCSMCGEDTNYDEGFYCGDCGASWPTNGQGGTWDEPDAKVCPASIKPFDRPNLGAEHESIRHHVWHCTREDGHEGKHRSDAYTEWSDE